MSASCAPAGVDRDEPGDYDNQGKKGQGLIIARFKKSNLTRKQVDKLINSLLEAWVDASSNYVNGINAMNMLPAFDFKPSTKDAKILLLVLYSTNDCAPIPYDNCVKAFVRIVNETVQKLKFDAYCIDTLKA